MRHSITQCTQIVWSVMSSRSILPRLYNLNIWWGSLSKRRVPFAAQYVMHSQGNQHLCLEMAGQTLTALPVPPLSDSLGTHQSSKNAKLGGLFVQLRMSSKLRNRGTFLPKIREI